jgi:RHS repeat-associated protein
VAEDVPGYQWLGLKGGFGIPFDPVSSNTQLAADGSIREFVSTPSSYEGSLAAFSASAGYDPITGESYEPSANDYSIFADMLFDAGKTGLSLDNDKHVEWLMDKGFFPEVIGELTMAIGQAVEDPVDSVSGAFLSDEVDLGLAGPLPIQIRRTYNSMNGAFGVFGYGWKLNTMPYLVVQDGSLNKIISAAELDGTVVDYVKGGTVWRASNPLQDSSPVNTHFSNFTVAGIGSTSNLRSQRVEMRDDGTTLDPWIGTNPPQRKRYTIYGADGSIREYYERDFPIGPDGKVIPRKRPYLYKWTDAQGNYLTFHFGLDDKQWDYGQLTKIVSSNGSFVSFEYNSPGQIISAYTNDGRRLAYQYDEFGDLISVRRPDGSMYRYSYEHSTKHPKSGASVATYSRHLINRVIQPEGRTLENDYDNRGRVTQQRATVGKGLKLVRNATFVYSHPDSRTAPLTGWTRIYDAFNTPSGTPSRDTNCLRHDYTDGLITAITDSLGQVIQQEWYTGRTGFPDPSLDPAVYTGFVLPVINTPPSANAPGGYARSLKRYRDKRGLVTHLWYDSRGNVILKKQTGDITGDGLVAETQTETNTYSATTNLPLTTKRTVENTSGLVTSLQTTVYDATYPYRPATVTQRIGSTDIAQTSFSYMNTGSGSKQAKGLLLTKVTAANSADASHIRFAYDARGFMTMQTQFSEAGLPTTPIASSSSADGVLRYSYNYRGERIEEIDSGGRKKNYEFDAMGRPTRSVVYDAAGTLLSASQMHYNLNGEVVWEDGPRSGPEDYIFHHYDADGRRIADVFWLSRAKSDGSGVEGVGGEDDLVGKAVVEYEYDAFDNLVMQIDPNGNYIRQSFDAIGQLKRKEYYQAKTNLLLKIEEFSYEPGGKVSRSVNAAGGVTYYFYTMTGQPRRQENPDGTVLEWRYTIDGRLKEEILSNRSKWVTSYNDAARTIVRKFYNAGGSLLATESRNYDRRGNLVSSTDLDGYTATTTYDGLGRPLVVTGPPASAKSAQQSATYAYNLITLTDTVTNALGEITISQRDVLGRSVHTEVKATAASPTPVSLVSYSYGADHQSVTVTRGDNTAPEAFSRIRTFTDTLGHGVLTHLYRSENAYDITKNVYDLAGNLIESIDARRQSTFMAYDGLNRLERTRLPDGAETTYAYDSLGGLIKRAMPAGLTWSATYDSSGRSLSEELRGSDHSLTRHFSRTYYKSGDYVGLPRQSVDILRGVTATTTGYDAFRRPTAVAMISSTGDLHGLTQTYAYDNRGHVTEHLQDYADASLVDSKVVRDFDGYGQAIKEEVLVDNLVHSTVEQYWNSAGRRERLDGDMGTAPLQRFTYEQHADGLLKAVTEAMTGTSHRFAFNYDRSGQLTSRVNPWRTQTILSRDLQGRILTAQTTTTAVPGFSAPFFQETAVWREDGRMNSYITQRSGSWDKASVYTYDARGHLVNETYTPAAGQSASIAYTYDQDGLGVRIQAAASGASDSHWQVASGGLDSFSRVVQENTELSGVLPAHGFAASAGMVRLDLRNLGTGETNPVQGVRFNPDSADGRWDVTLDLPNGTYELQARAIARDGAAVSPAAVSRFEVSADTASRIFTDYDQSGFANRRTWTSGRSQGLTWDVLGRLLAVEDFGDGQPGRRWAAIYDGGGRRMETRSDSLTEIGAVVAGTRITEKSLYDPQVEFLELAIHIGSASNPGETFWKVYGPDLNGGYGSLQGIGGLEATIRESDRQIKAVIGDTWGHGVASIEGALGAAVLTWTSTQVSGYGSLPGQVSKTLARAETASTTLQLATATVWRSHRIDSTGFYNLGARYYEPASGRFLSPDPFGHIASMSLYDYANGDPINGVDPDGRLGRKAEGTYDGVMAWDGWTSDFWNAVEVGGQGANEGLASSPITWALNEFLYRATAAEREAKQIFVNAAWELGIPAPMAEGAFFAGEVYAGELAFKAMTRTAAVSEVPITVERTTVFRVESAGNARLTVGEAGTVATQGENTLFLNFGQQVRAEEFAARRLAQGFDETVVKSFEVPTSYVDRLRSSSVLESEAHLFPDAPLRVDVRFADQFGLRAEQIQELNQVIIQGTGRVH